MLKGFLEDLLVGQCLTESGEGTIFSRDVFLCTRQWLSGLSQSNEALQRPAEDFGRRRPNTGTWGRWLLQPAGCWSLTMPWPWGLVQLVPLSMPTARRMPKAAWQWEAVAPLAPGVWTRQEWEGIYGLTHSVTIAAGVFCSHLFVPFPSLRVWGESGAG